MIVHVVAFRWQDDHDPAVVRRLEETVLARLPAELPELLGFWWGPDVGLRPGNADYAVVALLRDREAVATYFANPTHAAGIRDLAMPMVAERLAVQFEIGEEEAAWLAR